MAKKNKTATDGQKQPKKHVLSEKEKALVATSQGQKRFKRKDIIIASIITIVLVVVLIAGASVAANFIAVTLSAADVYSYTTVVEYLDSNEIVYTSSKDLTAETDKAIAYIQIGETQIRYYQSYNDMCLAYEKSPSNCQFYSSEDDFNKDDSMYYIIYGLDTEEYKEHFAEILA